MLPRGREVPQRETGRGTTGVGQPLLHGAKDAVNIVMRMVRRQPTPQNLIKDTKLHQNKVDGMCVSLDLFSELPSVEWI
eukprot:scaffold7131_cov131-Isochrysis_galbana.AAC.8